MTPSLVLLACLAAALPGKAPPPVERPEIVLQSGHAAVIHTLVLSRSGRFFASGADDSLVKLWDLASGHEIRTFRLAAGKAGALAFSPDERLLAVASSTKVQVFDVATGAQVRTFPAPAAVTGLVLSPDGKRFAQIYAEGYSVWDAKSGAVLLAVSAPFGSLRGVAFAPDGHHVGFVKSVGSGVKLVAEVFVYDLRHPAAPPVFQVSIPNSPWSLAFSPDGSELAVGSDGSPDPVTKERASVRIYRFPSGELARSFSGLGHGLGLAWIAGGKQLLVRSGQAGLTRVDAAAGKILGAIPGTADALGYWPERDLAVVTDGNRITVWEVTTARLLRTIGSPLEPVAHISFAAGGDVLWTVSRQGRVHEWNLARLTARSFADPGALDDRWEQRFGAADFSPDHRTLVTTLGFYGQHGVRAFDTRTGAIRWTIPRPPDRQTMSATFSPDGKTLAVGRTDKVTELWDAATGLEQRRSGSVYWDGTFSPDGSTYVGTASDNKLSGIDPATGAERFLLQDTEGLFTPLAFSPDGKLLYVNAQPDALVFDVATRKPIWRITMPSPSIVGARAAFSPDGKRLAVLLSGSAKPEAGTVEVQIFDVATRKLARILRGHDSVVYSLAFSPDGKLLATGGYDGQVKLWDPATGRELVSLVALGTEDFAFVTPDDDYSVSRGGLQGMMFRFEDRLFPPEQFDLRFNRPHVILERLGRSSPAVIDQYRRAYLRRLSRMGLTEAMLGEEAHLPVVALASPPAGETTVKQVQLRVTASDSKYLLDRLNLFVNDVPVFGSAGLDLRALKTRRHERLIPLELSAGRNKLQVSVLNEKGVESLRETAEVVYAGPTSKPDLFVLAVGVSKYANPSVPELAYAAKDAVDLSRTLEGKQSRFGKVVVATLVDGDATREKILALKAQLGAMRVDDELVVFFAGHGLLDARDGYFFATHDIDPDHPADRGLPYEALEGLLDGVPARQKLLLVDTCHAGEVEDSAPASAPALPPMTGVVAQAAPKPEPSGVKLRGLRVKTPSAVGLTGSIDLLTSLFADLRRGSGATVIASAAGRELAAELESLQNGAFTAMVLRAVDTPEADANHDGVLRVSELQEYVTRQVRALTKGAQTPTARRQNLADDFPVY